MDELALRLQGEIQGLRKDLETSQEQVKAGRSLQDETKATIERMTLVVGASGDSGGGTKSVLGREGLVTLSRKFIKIENYLSTKNRKIKKVSRGWSSISPLGTKRCFRKERPCNIIKFLL